MWLRLAYLSRRPGDNGAGGKQETLGIQYANYVTPTVEIGGKEYTVQLNIVDNESSNDKAPSAAATLVSARRVRCSWFLWLRRIHRRF